MMFFCIVLSYRKDLRLAQYSGFVNNKVYTTNKAVMTFTIF